MIPAQLNRIIRGRKSSRTRKRMRHLYGDYKPLPVATTKNWIILIAIFAVFGLFILGTLYWIFG